MGNYSPVDSSIYLEKSRWIVPSKSEIPRFQTETESSIFRDFDQIRDADIPVCRDADIPDLSIVDPRGTTPGAQSVGRIRRIVQSPVGKSGPARGPPRMRMLPCGGAVASFFSEGDDVA